VQSRTFDAPTHSKRINFYSRLSSPPVQVITDPVLFDAISSHYVVFYSSLSCQMHVIFIPQNATRSYKSKNPIWPSNAHHSFLPSSGLVPMAFKCSICPANVESTLFPHVYTAHHRQTCSKVDVPLLRTFHVLYGALPTIFNLWSWDAATNAAAHGTDLRNWTCRADCNPSPSLYRRVPATVHSVTVLS
jgi:hypothetical protein